MAAEVNQTLEVHGHFWLPARKDSPVAGILTFDQESGGRLNLIGTLSSSGDFSRGELREIKAIHGESDKSEYTLEGCTISHESRGAFGGAGRQNLRIARIIEGALFDTRVPTNVSSLSIDFTYLAEWTGLNGIRASQAVQGEDGVSEIKIRFKRIEGLSCDLPGSAKLSLNHSIVRTIAPTGNQRVSQIVNATFHFGRLTKIDDALRVASDFQDLLLIANDKVVAFESVRFGHPELIRETPSGQQFGLDARLYTRWRAQANQSSSKKHGYHDMCFTFDEIGGMTGIARWMKAAKRFRSQLERVSATRTSKGSYIQDGLLGRVAALESFHRTRYPKRRGVKPNGQPRELWLTERIDQLVVDAGKPFWMLFGSSKAEATPRIAAWRSRAKDERNNVAHHLGKDLHKDIEEMYYVSEAAYYLFVVLMLKVARAPRDAFEHLMGQQRYVFAGSHLRSFL